MTNYYCYRIYRLRHYFVTLERENQGVSDHMEDVCERLHVVDENDEVFVGINAFIVIGRHLLNEQWKAKSFSLPVIRPLADYAYNTFARLLYQWNRKRGSW